MNNNTSMIGEASGWIIYACKEFNLCSPRNLLILGGGIGMLILVFCGAVFLWLLLIILKRIKETALSICHLSIWVSVFVVLAGCLYYAMNMFPLDDVLKVFEAAFNRPSPIVLPPPPISQESSTTQDLFAMAWRIIGK